MLRVTTRGWSLVTNYPFAIYLKHSDTERLMMKMGEGNTRIRIKKLSDSIKMYYEEKKIKQDKYMLIKGIHHQEYVIILNLYPETY